MTTDGTLDSIAGRIWTATAPSRWFVLRRSIPLPDDARAFGAARQRIEEYLQRIRVEQYRSVDEQTVSFLGPFILRVRWELPRPLVSVTLCFRGMPPDSCLECRFDYRVYGWFAVAVLLLLVGPIIGSAPWALLEKTLVLLAFVWVPILPFWVNLTLFTRSLRRLISSPRGHDSHRRMSSFAQVAQRKATCGAQQGQGAPRGHAAEQRHGARSGPA